jgi:hypothetical protein
MMTTHRRLPSLPLVAALCISFALATPAHAGKVAACRGSSAFRNAEVNVVVLPYFPAGTSKRPLGGLGVQLALLLKLETLYRALSYDRWGVTLLTGSRKECDKDVVTRNLLNGSIAPGGRLIVVWGNVYVQDNDVYVQTFARAITNLPPGDSAKRSDVVMRLGRHVYTANLGSSDFAFPPEQLTRADIATIDASFRKAAFIYDTPSLGAKRRPLPIPNPGTCDDCPAR